MKPKNHDPLKVHKFNEAPQEYPFIVYADQKLYYILDKNSVYGVSSFEYFRHVLGDFIDPCEGPKKDYPSYWNF